MEKLWIKEKKFSFNTQISSQLWHFHMEIRSMKCNPTATFRFAPDKMHLNLVNDKHREDFHFLNYRIQRKIQNTVQIGSKSRYSFLPFLFFVAPLFRFRMKNREINAWHVFVGRQNKHARLNIKLHKTRVSWLHFNIYDTTEFLLFFILDFFYFFLNSMVNNI